MRMKDKLKLDIRPIRTDEDHEAALRTIEALWDAEQGTREFDHLDVLTTLVEAYEAQRWPVGDMDPVEAIEAAMAAEGRTQGDLAKLIGVSRASEVLARKRGLSLAMIRDISREWRVPVAVLVG